MNKEQAFQAFWNNRDHADGADDEVLARQAWEQALIWISEIEHPIA